MGLLGADLAVVMLAVKYVRRGRRRRLPAALDVRIEHGRDFTATAGLPGMLSHVGHRRGVGCRVSSRGRRLPASDITEDAVDIGAFAVDTGAGRGSGVPHACRRRIPFHTSRSPAVLHRSRRSVLSSAIVSPPPDRHPLSTQEGAGARSAEAVRHARRSGRGDSPTDFSEVWNEAERRSSHAVKAGRRCCATARPPRRIGHGWRALVS